VQPGDLLTTRNLCPRRRGCAINRVYSRSETFTTVKLGVPYALHVPASAPGSNSHELADDLAKCDWRAEDRRDLAAALRKGHKALKSLKNSWG
jgi:hypothetical protein